MAAFLNPKGYGDGAITGFYFAEASSSGGGGVELDDRALSHATGVFPLPRLKLDTSPTRDPIPIAEHGIPAEHSVSP